jgi:hypothetical protein
MDVFMSTLGGGETLGFDRAEVFLFGFDCVLHDTSISRVCRQTFQESEFFLCSGGL